MSPSGLQDLEAKTQHLIHPDEALELVDLIYALQTDQWTDEDFAALEQVIDRAIALLQVVNNADVEPIIDRLRIARDGAEQGMAPDPANRPTHEQLRAFVSAHL